MNGIKRGFGYTRTHLDWAADSVAPSRLGEDSVEVLLGVWHGDELRPLRSDKGDHGWAYSTLRVARRLVAEAAPEERPARSAAIEMVKAGLPSSGKWVVLLPMDPTPSGFLASAIGASSTKGQPTKAVALWYYSRAMGLLLAKQAN
jgi:CRISPR-associated endonuclease/helicase Cas3